jgi:GNAT superfamily N-acetyltransferase
VTLAAGATPVRIRPKEQRDVDDLVGLLAEVQRTDGYPRFLRGDRARFVTPPYERSAWVAVRDGAVVGHVALHDAASDPTCDAACRATGLPPERLAVLARLLVAPGVRRRGVARALVGVATEAAHAQGRRVVLDVVQDATAVGFYDALGWQRIEALRLDLGPVVLDLWVFLEPPS